EVDDTDLSRHYLSDPKLVAFIQGTHQTWKPSEGACSRCLEMYAGELQAKRLDPEEKEENTVVTHATDLIPAAAEDPGNPSLITIHGADFGRKFDLEDGESIIGRSEAVRIRINEENISRQHARLFKRGDEVIIEDLRSTNGTFVNTKKITSQPLKDGDL